MLIKKSNLYLFTFLSIFLSLFLVGAALSPFFLAQIRSIYLSMNLEVQHRQAQIIGRMLGYLLQQGESKKAVIAAFQASLAKTEVDRGYLCLVDEKTGIFVAHPIKNNVGKKVTSLNVHFDSLNGSQAMNWGLAIKEKKGTTGILTLPNGRSEVIDSFLVPATHLLVFSHENIARVNHEIAKFEKTFVFIFILLGIIVAFPASYAAFQVSRRYEKEIEKEQAKSEKLLLNILPSSIAKKLKDNQMSIAQRFDDVSVLFVDMVEFTPLASKLGPEQLVEMLNYIFSKFDAISQKFGLEKIKTIGDAYMIAGGAPEPKKDHLKSCIDASLEILALVKSEFVEHDPPLRIRVGIHTGPAIAGVIGTHKFSYDLWGETVNIASRLETTSLPDCIHCSEAVYERMKNDYEFLPRGKIFLKGVGKISTYFLVGEQEI